MSLKRVVVTGLGAVTPIGNSASEFAESLKAGRSGFGPITKFPPEHFPVKHAYEVKDARAKSKSSALDPFVQYILMAAEEAVRDSGLAWRALDSYRIGASISSSKGGVSTIEKYYERFAYRPSALVAALCYASLPPNIAAQWVAKRFRIHGPAVSYVAACATGLTAIIEGARLIRQNDVDVCFAGAGDASITRLMLAGYRRMNVYSRDELRPFDRERSGFVIGEGAGVVLLEEFEHARLRGAKMYGEITGTAYGCDVYSATRFDPAGHTLSRVLKKLLKDAALEPSDVDYVHLHGTGTQEGDRYEADEVRSVFDGTGGFSAKKPLVGGSAFGGQTRPYYSAIKSMTGHMLGASGACEFIGVLLSMRDGFIPPVSSCRNPDPECALNLVLGSALEKKVNVAVLHNMGFGGHTAAVAVRKVASSKGRKSVGAHCRAPVRKNGEGKTSCPPPD